MFYGLTLQGEEHNEGCDMDLKGLSIVDYNQEYLRFG